MHSDIVKVVVKTSLSMQLKGNFKSVFCD